MAHRERRLQSLNLQRSNGDGSSMDEALIDRLPGPGRPDADPQREWLIQMLKTLEPNHCRWLCSFWIDGLSLTEIARREGINRQMLRKVQITDITYQEISGTVGLQMQLALLPTPVAGEFAITVR